MPCFCLRCPFGRTHIAPGEGAPREHIDLGPPTTKDLELEGDNDEGLEGGGDFFLLVFIYFNFLPMRARDF